eukprot:m.14171 g.14171  ORF g.14171 m.14171 type:complete len:203 (+) comp10029_c0_seq1:97-705(+)
MTRLHGKMYGAVDGLLFAVLTLVMTVGASGVCPTMNISPMCSAITIEECCGNTDASDIINILCAARCCDICGLGGDEQRCVPRQELSHERMLELCPRFQEPGGFENKGKPVYGPNPPMCEGSTDDHSLRLELSMANGLFGGDRNTRRDCNAWCVYDVSNPLKHFRWVYPAGCWKFKGRGKCTDATKTERRFAKSTQAGLCPA